MCLGVEGLGEKIEEQQEKIIQIRHLDFFRHAVGWGCGWLRGGGQSGPISDKYLRAYPSAMNLSVSDSTFN